MGMFSTLNYLIDAPLAEILKPIPLCAEAKEALLQHTGRAGMLYDLIVIGNPPLLPYLPIW